MGQVFLKKKQNISEDTVSDSAVVNPTIAGQIARLEQQINTYQTNINNLQKQIIALKQQDAQLRKTTEAKEKADNATNNQEQNQNNQGQNQNNNGQAYNESVDYIYRKAIRLSKKLYEEKKETANLGREIKKELDELELSYTMDLGQCKKLARKVESVLDDNFDKENSSNKWPTIEKEIKKYFKRAEDVNYSNSEKGKVLGVIKDILKDKPEYDWVFGNDNKELEKEIKDAVE